MSTPAYRLINTLVTGPKGEKIHRPHLIHPGAVQALSAALHAETTCTVVHLSSGASFEVHAPLEQLARDLGIAPANCVPPPTPAPVDDSQVLEAGTVPARFMQGMVLKPRGVPAVQATLWRVTATAQAGTQGTLRSGDRSIEANDPSAWELAERYVWE